MENNITRVYQRNRKIQRLVLTIPASITDWIDTGLNSYTIGTRPIGCGWKARVAYNPQEEPTDIFRQRISNIRLRFVRDPSIEMIGPHYAYTAQEVDIPVLLPMLKVSLKVDKGTFLRFPMSPGRVEVNLMGAKSTDMGSVRLYFSLAIAAADDICIFQGTADSVEDFFLTSLSELPEPPWPDL